MGLASDGARAHSCAHAHQRLACLEKALAACDREMYLVPGSVGERAELDHALYGMDRHAVALAAYDRTVVCDRGDALYGVDRHAVALAAYDRTVEIDPGNALMHHHRALALQGLGRHADALAAYGLAAALDPGRAYVHYGRAMVLGRLGRHWEETGAIGDAIGLWPKSSSYFDDWVATP